MIACRDSRRRADLRQASWDALVAQAGGLLGVGARHSGQRQRAGRRGRPGGTGAAPAAAGAQAGRHLDLAAAHPAPLGRGHRRRHSRLLWRRCASRRHRSFPSNGRRGPRAEWCFDQVLTLLVDASILLDLRVIIDFPLSFVSTNSSYFKAMATSLASHPMSYFVVWERYSARFFDKVAYDVFLFVLAYYW